LVLVLQSTPLALLFPPLLLCSGQPSTVHNKQHVPLLLLLLLLLLLCVSGVCNVTECVSCILRGCLLAAF
jgi:hypothetical protein